MKFITHFQVIPTGPVGRGAYLSRPLEGGSEQVSAISDILEQPLRFSLSDLSSLEKAIKASDGKLSGPEQNQFQRLVNLHLVRLQS